MHAGVGVGGGGGVKRPLSSGLVFFFLACLVQLIYGHAERSVIIIPAL